jgi:hypothetical protein
MGIPAVIALVEARGGVRIHVPLPPHISTSILLGILGAPALQKLAERLGGAAISVPVCREWRARLMLHSGRFSHAEIALTLGCTDNWVRKLSRADHSPMPRTHMGLRAARKLAAERRPSRKPLVRTGHQP